MNNAVPIPMKNPKRVSIEEADNGFVINCYTGEGETVQKVATDLSEAMSIMHKMMGMKKDKKEMKEVKGSKTSKVAKFYK